MKFAEPTASVPKKAAVGVSGLCDNSLGMEAAEGMQCPMEIQLAAAVSRAGTTTKTTSGCDDGSPSNRI